MCTYYIFHVPMGNHKHIFTSTVFVFRKKCQHKSIVHYIIKYF